jgi:hypothetical protein
MDPECFDDLTRVLAAPSRRKLLAAVGATVLSAYLGLGADQTTAKKKCNCKGKTCGCKGKCGTCGQNESCAKGQCVPDSGGCTPTCQSQARVCGDDGCGDSCGDCTQHGVGGVCNSNGHCTCAEGYRGCNAANGSFECADILTDPKHCGSCDGCPDPRLSCCNGQCTDLMYNPSNCGGCGTLCQTPNSTCCGGKCVDVNSDPANCGACGGIFGGECPQGFGCFQGRCQ